MCMASWECRGLTAKEIRSNFMFKANDESATWEANIAKVLAGALICPVLELHPGLGKFGS